jgi:YtkA-like
MHVRLASDPGHRGVTLRPGIDFVSLGIIALIVTAGCGSRAANGSAVTVDVNVSPPQGTGGATGVVLTLRDRDRQPVRGATLQVEAFMSHPGMAPVVATAVERGGGVYEAPLQLTMGGDWILRVTGTLPDGRTVHRQIELVAHR